MLLRKLEAYGFKSFADKTEVEFGEGITGIVGPNGSGKSNISDAIRWVLGEQSVKNLRGTKMEDVIFAGSVGRRPLGAAEVSLTFDNFDGALPIDFNEVIITRRVFRSGESEYFINKNHCRLKDIYDLFADTGLGRDAMSVIGQNKVDEVLNSKPEERRSLFEEAAGISKYKQRKKESLRKLEDTTNNLLRVSDIIAEIETQLGPLKESAEKTRRYNFLKQDLISFQVTLLINKIRKAEKMIESTVLQKEHITDESVQVSTAIISLETEQETYSLKIISNEETLSNLNSTISETETSLERLNGRQALLEEKTSQAQSSQQRIQEEIKSLEYQKNETRSRSLEIANQRFKFEKNLNEINSSLGLENNQYQQLHSAIEEIQNKIDLDKEKSFEHLQEVLSERNKLANLEKELSRIRIRENSILNEKKHSQEQISKENETLALTNQQIEDLQQKLFKNAKERTTVLEKKELLYASLSAILDQEKEFNGHINMLHSRFKVLTSMQEEYEGFTKGIKHIFKSNSFWRPDIYGAVAQLVNVSDTYVTAIEIALGGALQHIVTKDDQVAKYAIEFLKKQNLGRATFLPLNTVKSKRLRETELKGISQAGFIGVASDLVKCDSKYRNIVEFLLGRILVTRDMDTALKIAKNNAYSFKIVTLDGDLVNLGGSMSGGSIYRKEAGLLSRNNEIQSIEEKVLKLREELTFKQENITVYRNEIKAIDEQYTLLEKNRQDLEIRQAEFGVRLEKVKLDLQRLNSDLITFTDEIQTCSREKIKIAEMIEQSKLTVLSLENRDIKYKQDLNEWQNQLKNWQLQKDQYSNRLTDLKVQQVSLKKELSLIFSEEEKLSQTREKIDGQLLGLTTEKDTLLTLCEKYAKEVSTVKSEIIRLSSKRDSCILERDTIFHAKLSHLSSLQKIEKELKELRRKQTDFQSRLHEIEMLHAKYTYENTNCHEQLRQSFLMSFDVACNLYRHENKDDIYSSIKLLEEQIGLLGSINPAAIEEYEKLYERYEFLQNQYNDLINAKEYLSSIIRDIDHTMSQKFTQAFKEISEYFSDIFAKLFGGGKAELTLTMPENLLESGIDITVQPPGKKLQNLILLSGGERALTVIALLFAFLTYKPAPFIVVDEIDAALDEANVERFSAFLRDYAKNTQFIVVTHRKGTMEAANVIHGVTIEESGISRLISVKLMDKAG